MVLIANLVCRVHFLVAHQPAMTMARGLAMACGPILGTNEQSAGNRTSFTPVFLDKLLLAVIEKSGLQQGGKKTGVFLKS